ncbi:hypothetical protein GS584_14995 [Rhodococcus hoagii]|nr:hypothetical protein [Prescottella equi]
MTPERIAQLDALGFNWGPAMGRAAVEQHRLANAIAHLTDYVAEHGHARVPHRFTCSDGSVSDYGVTGRRGDRRSHTPDRITALDQILSFDWGTTRTKFLTVRAPSSRRRRASSVHPDHAASMPSEGVAVATTMPVPVRTSTLGHSTITLPFAPVERLRQWTA